MFEPDLSVLDDLPYDGVERLLLDSPWTPDGVERLSRRERLSLAWSIALASAEEQISGLMSAVPGAMKASIGFLDPEVDPALSRADDSRRFGVIIYSEAVLVGGLDRDADFYTQIGARIADGYEISFPVVVRSVFYEPASSLGYWAGAPGRVACWVTTRSGACEGWLTARHIAYALGNVVDSARECVDAAVVDGPQPGEVQRRRTTEPVVAGMAMEAEFAGKSVPCVVNDVPAATFGLLGSMWFPVRFSLSESGVPGDSGGLVSHPSPDGERDPAGLYLGRYVSPRTGRPEGVAQALYQLERLLDLEVYQ